MLPTLTAFYRHHYGKDVLPKDPSASLIPKLDELLDNAEAQQELLPPGPVRELLQAMQAAGIGDARKRRKAGGEGGMMSAEAQEEEHPQEFIRSFMDKFYQARTRTPLVALLSATDKARGDHT